MSTSTRADARRNREQLLVAAAAVFQTAGDRPVTLEAVARAAGVGIGTLYRHFPTRDALVEAVYLHELDEVCAAAAELAAHPPADRALRTWVDRYADFVRAKYGMSDGFLRLTESGTTSETRSRVVAAVALLLDAGAADGTVRTDLAPDDVVAAMLGALRAAVTSPDPRQSAAVLDLLLDALRPR